MYNVNPKAKAIVAHYYYNEMYTNLIPEPHFNMLFNLYRRLIVIICNLNKRAQRALDRSPETKDFKFPFFIALSTTGDTWQSKS